MKADELRRQGYERGRADAEAEVMSLRQRVSELEGADLASDLRACMDELADARVTEEQHVKRIAELEAKLARCAEALKEIAEGAGAFSRDPLTHAANCIEAMKTTARAALAAAKEE